MKPLTPEQEQMKTKLIGTYEEAYTQGFKTLFYSYLGPDPAHTLQGVVADAFGINRKDLLIKSVKMVLDSIEEDFK